VRGTVQDGKIIVNRAFIDSADTLKTVLKEEHSHWLLSSDEGRQAIRAAMGSNLGLSQLADLSVKYPIQPGESVLDYRARLTDEFIARAASEELPIWKQIVERGKGWLADKGIGELNDEETARSIVRSLKAGKSTVESAPLATPFNALDTTAEAPSEEENSNLAARYNLTSEQVKNTVNKMLRTKQSPTRILTTRNQSFRWKATPLRNGSIAINSEKISSEKDAQLAPLRAGLHGIWGQPQVQGAWQNLQSGLREEELRPAFNRLKNKGLPIDFPAVHEEAAIAQVTNPNSRGRNVENFHKAIRAAIQQKYGVNLPAIAYPRLKEATIQFLRERAMQGKPTGIYAVVPVKSKPQRNVLWFKGMEVRAVRDLSHLGYRTLRRMARDGSVGTTKYGKLIGLHHLAQNPKGPLVEMPRVHNKISNIVQHPFGNTTGSGLTKPQRRSYATWREEYWR
jgi:hypothetical protein